MDKRTYMDEIKDINAYLSEHAVRKNYNRNRIHFYRPYVKKPLNIMGSFEEAIEAEGGSAPEFVPHSKRSFGMIAEIGFAYFREQLLKENSPYANAESFKAYVDQNYELFCIDRDEYVSRTAYNEGISFEQYQKAFFARCAIACSRAFGFTFDCEDEAFLAELKNDSNIKLIEKKPNEGNRQKETCSKGSYTVYGRMSETLICKYGKTELILYSRDRISKETGLEYLYTEGNEPFCECVNVALYSGVIPRLCRVEYCKPEIGNSDIHKIVFHLGRTSYMTMHAFSYGEAARLLKHPFLQVKEGDLTLADINYRFDETEVAMQTMLYGEDGAGERNDRVSPYIFETDIKKLNEYLSKSWHIHNINISGNIITGDNHCIFVKRSSVVSDANHLFCSVNGGSEIDDSRVSYYKNSVQEDIPTIKYGREHFYFGGELTREAIAELGISDNSPYWKYYGFTSMSGYRGKDSKHALWLHFNVLGEKNCSDSLEQITQNRLSASERFENENIYGYSITVVDKKRDYWKSLLKVVLNVVVDSQDIITTLLMTLIVGFSISFTEIESMIAIGFVILFFINLILQLADEYQDNKYLKKKMVLTYKPNWSDELFKKIGGKKGEIDWIFYILTRMRVLSIMDKE